MQTFIFTLLQLLIIASSAHAGRVVSERAELLRAATARMLKVTDIRQAMAWERGGVIFDNFIEHLSKHETDVYNLYSEPVLRIQLGYALEKLDDDIFFLSIYADGISVHKYFLGVKPDLKKIVSEVINMNSIRDKMSWSNGGVAMDDIVAEVIKLHPNIRTLYMRASHNNTEDGLRIAIGKAMDKDLEDGIFTLSTMINGKSTKKYFLGIKPDLEEIALEIIDKYRNKMEWQNGGLAMDEILAFVKWYYPHVYNLYVQASVNKNSRGLISSLGRALDRRLDESFFTISLDGNKDRKYFWGEQPVTKDLLAKIIRSEAISTKMEWHNGGATFDDIIEQFVQLYPGFYDLYRKAYNKDGNELHRTFATMLGALMRNEDIFSIKIGAGSRYNRKYFHGKRPDIEKIVLEILSMPELRNKMRWENGGLSADEIMAVVMNRYPEVYHLYVQSSPDKNDQGLRLVLGKAMRIKMPSDIFAKQVAVNGKLKSKYFLGTRSDYEQARRAERRAK